jgi:hypothetical protein
MYLEYKVVLRPSTVLQQYYNEYLPGVSLIALYILQVVYYFY